MKPGILATTLMLAASQASAQVGELANADVIDRTSITNPAEAVELANGHWMALTLPVLEGTRSPCCWRGKWSGMGEVGCSLEEKHHSYGSSSESPLAENVILFGKVENGALRKLRVVGEQCPVDGNGAQVNWIGDVDGKSALDWLEAAAVSAKHDPVGNSALYAMAMHRSNEASQRLYALAQRQDDEISEQAVFWLGEARGEAGFNTLKHLLSDLPQGETRREINFALAQNQAPAAMELLMQISRTDNDPEQRSEALFWLAEEYPEQAKDMLLEVINSEKDEDVLEEAIFAISQLPGEIASSMLLDLAKDESKPREIRREAIFWLANSDDDAGVAALTELLTQ